MMIIIFFNICFACINVGSINDCSKNGICIFDQRKNSTRCACDVGFFGETCADLCTMNGFAYECSYHGICAFDQRINGTRCICDIGFFGSYCNTNMSNSGTTSFVSASTTNFLTSATTSTVMSSTAPALSSTSVASTATALSSSSAATSDTLPVNTFATTTFSPITFSATRSVETFSAAVTKDSLTTIDTFSFSNCIDYTNYLKGGVQVCSGHGLCELYPPRFLNSGYYCKCDERYFGAYCEKEYKSKLTAFLLEFLIGWTGAESFYIGETAAGIFKLLLGLFGCCGLICAGVIFFGSEGEKPAPAMCCMIFVCLACCAISLWVTINWIMILTNSVTDSDGNPLYREFK